MSLAAWSGGRQTSSMFTTLLLFSLLFQSSPVPEPASFIICCARGQACQEPKDGACPDGLLPHECSDELFCDEAGDACWHECKPATLS